MDDESKIIEALIAMGFAASTLDEIDSEVSDAIRDQMDDLWYGLSLEGKNTIRQGRQLPEGAILALSRRPEG